jgi:hypothetical protein
MYSKVNKEMISRGQGIAKYSSKRFPQNSCVHVLQPLLINQVYKMQNAVRMKFGCAHGTPNDSLRILHTVTNIPKPASILILKWA